MGYKVYCTIHVILSLCFTHILGFLEFSSKNGELFSIAINKEKSSVFVGGHNKLYKLTRDLQISLEYDACELVNSNQEFCDSDIKVVKENTKGNYMMVCGTVAYGECAVLYSNGTFAPFMNSTVNHSTAKYIGSKKSVVAFFGHDFFGDSLLYVAMGYDGRPLTFYPYVISERKMKMTNGTFQFLYYHLNENYTMKSELLNISYLDVVYGFEDQSHSYFISNQNNSQEGIISQSCKGTSIGKQYIESKLCCGGSYYITDAFFLASEQSLNSGTLFVIFYDHATDTSKLCSFPQNIIHEYFSKAVSNCHQQLQIPWMADSNISCKGQGNTDVCTMEVIMRVDGQLREFPVYLTTGKVTALAARVQAQLGETVFLGFDNGILKKVHPGTNKTLLVTDVAKNKTQGIKRGGLVINNKDQHLYIMCKTKVFLFPLDSCEFYNNCRDCLKDLDGCGWCLPRPSNPEACMKSSECSGAAWYKNTCKPRVSNVSPNSGPIAGGTLVTITGEFVAENASSVTVEICNTICDVNSTTYDEIRCLTKEIDKTEDCNLTVKLRDSVHSGHLLCDSAHYSYKKPEAKDIRPTFGPLLGGITMAVIGINLDVGATCRVFVGDKECQLLSRSEKEILCKIPPSNNPTNSTDCNLFIDKERLRTPNNFRYVPNPIVSNIYPKTVIKSGGTNITLIGSNLNAVGSVLLTFSYGPYVQRAKRECSFSDDGISMICVTPKTDVSTKIPNSAQIQFTHYHSAEDASSYFRQNPSNLTDLNLTVVADPKVNGDQKEFLYNADTAEDNYTIVIQGEDFDVVDRNETRAYVGTHTCRIVNMSAKNLSCIPDFLSYIRLEGKMNIKLWFGENLELSGGYVLYRGKFKLNNSNATTYIPFVAVVSVVGGLVFIIVIVVVLMKGLGVGIFRRTWHADNYVVEYSSGRSRVQGESSLENASVQNRENDYQEQTFSKSTEDRAPLLSSIDEDLLQSLRVDSIIIERDNLILGELLGKGHFGCVYKGYLQLVGVKEEKIVAVKTIHNEGPRDMDVNGFLKEALIMKDFHHNNVMELVGICVGSDDMPLVVLPYLRHGDLLTYIRDENNLPMVKDLMMFCADIANGMCYLAELKFVHRDLAARNCMLDENLKVKVADFGLSRDIYEKEYYSCENKQTKLPVKWMAPESLERGVYTVLSDVWSYGIVLWEVVTRGINPYPGVDNWDILRYLTDGRRMDKPKYCPDELYQIMLQCWSWEPSERPAFGILAHAIPDMVERLVQRSFRKGSVSNTETTYINTGICRDFSMEFKQ